jgi:predicted DNA repair protein MutK
MAGSSLLALIDDIATVLDDISVMTKVATRKTAGVLGDDLALNAQQVAGVRAERELPVVWAVAKGSFRNKLILVPAALAISLVVPWAILPLLMVGGAYLAYEGAEKLAHKTLHRKAAAAHHGKLTQALTNPNADLAAVEQDKIQGAIRTDFVLSAEIIVITLGIVADAPFLSQIAVLAGIAVIMTAGVYGLVAGIVKLDDAGLFLSTLAGEDGAAPLLRRIGRMLLAAAPWLMKTLSVVGTAAMFVVGGGILTHGLPGAHDLIHALAHAAGAVPGVGSLLEAVTPLLADVLVGIATGALVLGAVTLGTQRTKGSQDAG